jgi:hypothetical protein
LLRLRNSEEGGRRFVRIRVPDKGPPYTLILRFKNR